MDKVITYSFADNFIERISDFICENYGGTQHDFSKIALIFGGKRPALFVKRQMAILLKTVFFPPAFYSMDEFVRSIVLKHSGFSEINEMDGCFMLHSLTRKILPQMLTGRESFSKFYPWARELLKFIEQLDLEDIRPEALQNIQKSASIGYDVPPNINILLKNIVLLRDAYQTELQKQKKYSHGLLYQMAAQLTQNGVILDFEQIFFCNLFYLHKTEKEIVKHYYATGKTVFFFQKDDHRWPVLEAIEQELGCKIIPDSQIKNKYELNIYSGSDTHAQVCMVREILKKIKNKDKTVILLPDPDSVIPLLSEITSVVEDYNVSIGYPLKRSALYSLFELIFKAQETKKDTRYYTRDYLKALSHPLIKNLILSGQEPAITRVLTHKVEEFLIGIHSSAIAGSLFVDPLEIEKLSDIYQAAETTLQAMEINTTAADLKKNICQLHQLLFYSWQQLCDFKGFASCLNDFLNILIKTSFLSHYPINLLITKKIYDLCQQLETADFCLEEFAQEEILRIFMDDLEKEMVSFSGTPLKGLQILGLLETRALNFENVIVMDLNEGVLPRLNIYEPLIPREVMLSLELNRLENEDEIQRYQFMRLLGAAKRVHLVYNSGIDKEKSRFIQKLIWETQKEKGSLGEVYIPSAGFGIKIQPEKQEIFKSPQIIEFLQKRTYSASSVNTYLNCPLRFYYQYVLGLEEKEDLLEDPEARDIGTFIHNLLEDTYKPFNGKKPLFDRNFSEYFNHFLDDKFDREFSRKMKSDSFMLKEIVSLRMNNFLKKEAERDILEIVCLEEEKTGTINLNCGQFKFKYRIDRIDRLADESLLIIDYKTGSTDLKPASLEKIQEKGFRRLALKNTIKSFQLPLYYYFVKDCYCARDINAAFYNLKSSTITALFKNEEPLNKEQAMSLYIKGLDAVMAELLDEKNKFSPDTENPNYCAICPFFYLCR